MSERLKRIRNRYENFNWNKMSDADFRREINYLSSEIVEMDKDFGQLEFENERLRKALEFYGDKTSYVTQVAGMEMETTVMLDGGEVDDELEE